MIQPKRYEWILTDVDYIVVKRGGDSVPLTWLKRREIFITSDGKCQVPCDPCCCDDCPCEEDS